MPIVESTAVTGGVTSGAERHAAAALDDIGGLLGVEEFPATEAGRQALLDWLAGFGPVRLVGTATAEASGGRLARHLQGAGVAVVVVGRAEGQGPPDGTALEAVSTARAALSGQGRALPVSCGSLVEAISVLMVARRSAERDRAAAVDLVRAVVAASPSHVGSRSLHSPPWR